MLIRSLLGLLLSGVMLATVAMAAENPPNPRDGVYVESSEPCGDSWNAATSLFSDGKTVWASKIQCEVRSREWAHGVQILKEQCTYLDGSNSISATIAVFDADHIEASFIDENDVKKYRFCQGLKR